MDPHNRRPNLVHPALLMAFVTLSLTGCEAVKGIFKAGFWVGIVIAVFAVVALAGVARMAARH